MRELCKRTGTIAEVADHLSVNRVQMSRILNDESFPKPGLMKRICDHFSVNARILLEPLADLEAEHQNQNAGKAISMAEPLSYAFFGRDCCVAPILWRLPSLGVDIRASKQSKPLFDYMDRLFSREAFQDSLSIQEREMRL